MKCDRFRTENDDYFFSFWLFPICSGLLLCVAKRNVVLCVRRLIRPRITEITFFFGGEKEKSKVSYFYHALKKYISLYPQQVALHDDNAAVCLLCTRRDVVVHPSVRPSDSQRSSGFFLFSPSSAGAPVRDRIEVLLAWFNPSAKGTLCQHSDPSLATRSPLSP